MIVRRSFDGRLLGQTWETPFVPVPPGPITADSIEQLIEQFHVEYSARFGHRFDHLPVQGVTYRVELVVPAEKVDYPELPAGAEHPRPSGSTTLRHLSDAPLEAGVYQRDELGAGPGSRARR